MPIQTSSAHVNASGVEKKSRYSFTIFSQGHLESSLALHIASCKDTLNSKERRRLTFPFICEALNYDGKSFHANQIVKNTPCSTIQRWLLVQQSIGGSF